MNISVAIATSIVSGLLGVIVTLVVQRCHEKKTQKISVFQTLLANRYDLTGEANVRALNMIDVVFYNDVEVRKRFAAFIEAANAKPPDGMQIVQKYLRLVESIAESVGYKKGIDWERINSYFYSPIALSQRQQENDLLRKANLENSMALVRQRAAAGAQT